MNKALLSQIIDMLNEKFGTELTKADQIWFDQQVEAAAEVDDLREVALATPRRTSGTSSTNDLPTVKPCALKNV